MAGKFRKLGRAPVARPGVSPIARPVGGKPMTIPSDYSPVRNIAQRNVGMVARAKAIVAAQKAKAAAAAALGPKGKLGRRTAPSPAIFPPATEQLQPPSPQQEEQQEQAQEEQPQEEQQEQAQEEQPQEEQPQEEQPQEEQPQEEQQEQAQEEQPQEEQPQEPQPEALAGIEPMKFPLVSSHVSNGKLHTSGICVTPSGCMVLHCRTKAPHPSFGYEAAIYNHRKILTDKVLSKQQKEHIASVVSRARSGDQNAMAIIALVRENAKRGLPRAQQSFKLLKDYIESKPVKSGKFGYDVESEFYETDFRPEFGKWSSTMLANGPRISNSKINRIVSSFGVENVEAFITGMKKWKDVHDLEHKEINAQLNKFKKQIFELGRIVGRACKLQAVRKPNSVIARFDEKVAWELGE